MNKNEQQPVLTLNLSPEQKQLILNATGKIMDTVNVMVSDGIATASPSGAKPIAVQGPQGLQLATGLHAQHLSPDTAAPQPPQGSKYVRGPNGPQLVSESHAKSPQIGSMMQAQPMAETSNLAQPMLAPGIVRGPQGPQALPIQRPRGSQVVRGPQGPQIM